MITIAIFIALVLLLMILRSVIQQFLQGWILLLGGSQYQGIMIYSLIFLPGIVIHETAHFLAAAMLGVPTGDISLLPRRDSSEDGRVALGTVKVAKTDFIRSSLIGAAPFFVGTLTLFFCVTFFLKPAAFDHSTIELSTIPTIVEHYFSNPQFWFGLYLVFAVANTMFVSKEDARTFPVIAVFLLIVGIAIYLSGKSTQVIAWALPKITRIASYFVSGLSAAVVIDLIIVACLYIIVKVTEKVTRKRIVYGSKRFFW